MKQSLAVTLAGLQGLGSTDDHRERPVDRLGALALAQSKRGDEAARESFMCSLGADLIAFKFANRAGSQDDAIDKLSILLRNLKLKASQRDKVARQAVMEFCISFCLTCRGSKEIPNYADHSGAQPMKACPSCDGTGLRRYSDAERTEAMGEAFSKSMEEAHRLLGWAESLAVRLVRERLERA